MSGEASGISPARMKRSPALSTEPQRLATPPAAMTGSNPWKRLRVSASFAGEKPDAMNGSSSGNESPRSAVKARSIALLSAVAFAVRWFAASAPSCSRDFTHAGTNDAWNAPPSTATANAGSM